MNTTNDTTTTMAGKLTTSTFETFALAGRAVFTAVSPTGTRFTFRVRAPVGRLATIPGAEGVRFVDVLTGPDNTHDFTFIGVIKGGFRHSSKSAIAADAKSVLAFGWIWRHRADPTPVELHHEGRCGKCGRALTTPESIESGIGPVCAGRS